ncbi:hypothetical protein AB1Y20_023448 [Prymnesium parvum]|uniref:Uncharacterized protein n=1 Tax=Prymnesium parvum TaxID=97485 RepID=A0AB34JFG2_PRYPA
MLPVCIEVVTADKEPCAVPAEVQAAVDAGRKDEVEKLLATPPEGMSKSQKKTLLKQAEINAKKLEKAAAKPSAAPAPSAKKAAAAGAAASPAAAVVVPAAAGTPVGAAEGAVVELLLLRMESLGLPADAIRSCREQHGALSLAIAPQLNVLRNEAYVAGFTARLE